jgi:hypothetical protein
MRDGDVQDAINPWAVVLFRSLKTVHPVTDVQQSAYDQWRDQTSAREEARRDRLHGAGGIIPTSIWIVLFLIAGVAFAYMLFFADSGERRRSQAMMMGSSSTIVVVTLLAIVALDNPYGHGVGGIQPVAMERSLRFVDQARAALGDRTPIPCDAKGAAPRS